MRLISWVWFWYVVIGFILGGGSVYLLGYLKEKTVKLVWYEWVLGVLFIFTMIFMGQTFIGSLQEGETTAAWLSVGFFAIPAIIMGVIAFRSVKSRLVTE